MQRTLSSVAAVAQALEKFVAVKDNGDGTAFKARDQHLNTLQTHARHTLQMTVQMQNEAPVAIPRMMVAPDDRSDAKRSD